MPRLYRHLIFLCGLSALLSGCGGLIPADNNVDGAPAKIDYSRLDQVTDAVPRHEPRSRYGNPDTYEEGGRTYQVLSSSQGYVRRGTASWYGTKFHGRRTSSGERYDMFAMTAAHKRLPLPTYARVTNLQNGKSVIVKINDRGPFVDDRIIDLSYAAAYKLDIIKSGTGLVEVVALDPGNPQQLQQDQVIAATPLTPVTSNLAPVPIAVPAAPAVAEAPVTANRQQQKNMFLQVGAFSSLQNAELLRQRLQNSAFNNISISQASGNRFNVYRVRLGPLQNESAAQGLVERLLNLGLGRGHIVLD